MTGVIASFPRRSLLPLLSFLALPRKERKGKKEREKTKNQNENSSQMVSQNVSVSDHRSDAAVLRPPTPLCLACAGRWTVTTPEFPFRRRLKKVSRLCSCSLEQRGLGGAAPEEDKGTNSWAPLLLLLFDPHLLPPIALIAVFMAPPLLLPFLCLLLPLSSAPRPKGSPGTCQPR